MTSTGQQPPEARRAKVFVASSSEALNVARAVKRRLEADLDVEVWDEDLFDLNQGTLEGLLNLSAFYDFAVAVFTKDDEARIRGREAHVVRDNVVFEFGLFLGRLGPRRVFFIAEEGVNIMSDFSGVTVATFRKRANLTQAVAAACERIRRQMDRTENMATFSILPSTSLAIAYHENFLRRIFQAFSSVETFTIERRDARGRVTATESVSTRDRTFVVNVEVPQRLKDLEPAGLAARTRQLNQVVLTTPSRSYPFYVNTAEELGREGDDLDLFDIPTIMLASKRAIDRIFGDAFLADEERRELVESREIANFERTLRLLIDDATEEHHFSFRVRPTAGD